MSEIDYDKLAYAIAKAVRNPEIVQSGQVKNPYKQFSFTIADNQIESVYYTFNFIRIMELSNSTNVFFRFGQTGQPTNVVDAGIGFELPEAVDVVQIINQSGGPITITIGLAVGRIYDDRLNVSGSISVVNEAGTCLEVKNCGDDPYLAVDEKIPTDFTTLPDVTVTTAGATIVSTGPTRAEAIITNLSSSINVRIGDSLTSATRGARLAPGASITLKITDAIRACTESGSATLSILIINK